MFTWIVITIVRSLRSDKILFELPINCIETVKIKFGKGPFQYGVLSFSTKEKKYKIRFKNEIKNEIEAIYSFLLNLK